MSPRLVDGAAPVGGGTNVGWRQVFDTVAHFRRIAELVAAADDENRDRLTAGVFDVEPAPGDELGPHAGSGDAAAGRAREP